MIRYRSGQIKKFLYNYDWNDLFQEIATILIGIGIGMYCYEKKVGILGKFSGGAVGKSDYPLATAGLVIIGMALLVKILIYASMFDANFLKSGKIKSKSLSRTRCQRHFTRNRPPRCSVLPLVYFQPR